MSPETTTLPPVPRSVIAADPAAPVAVAVAAGHRDPAQVADRGPGLLEPVVVDLHRPGVHRVARPAVVRVLLGGQVGHRAGRGPAAAAGAELGERRLAAAGQDVAGGGVDGPVGGGVLGVDPP